MKILLLEDDPAIAGALGTFLTEKGCTVTGCASLAGARQLLEDGLPDAAVLDWNLPDGDGAAFCRELRQRYPRLAILLLTVRGRRGGSGADDALTCGGIRLDEARQAVTCGGVPVALAPLEYQLLRVLLQNKGRTVTRQQLLESLWDHNGHFVNDNTLTVTMKRLREKLGRPACIKTVRSFGYRLEEDAP